VKAAFYDKYGSPDLLELREMDVPVVADGDVLIRIRAASLNPLDWRVMSGKPFMMRMMMGGLLKPKRNIPGVDLAGLVEAVGKDVTQFKPGDEVFGTCAGSCAEYACAKEGKLMTKPAGLTVEEAAAIPLAALTALQAVRDKGRLQSGQKVLINGASGGVGTFTVQIAKAFGAVVTGVCSTRNVELVRSLGADEVVDYTKEDFIQSGPRYDLIIDNAASRSLSDLRRVLAPEGVVAITGAPHRMSNWSLIMLLVKPGVMSLLGRQKFVMLMANMNQDDLLVLKDLIEAGKVKPVIDRTYPLAEAAAAMGYLEEGHARGKVVVTM